MKTQKVKKQNKFNARRIEYKDMTFDSKKEFEYYLFLESERKLGNIIELRIHFPYEIIPANDEFKAVTYIADFVYREPDGFLHVDDCKGLRKGAAYSLFKIKQKLIYDRYKILVHEV